MTKRRKRIKCTPSADGRRRVLCYVRVSTTEQAEQGVSLAAQERRLRQYIAALGDQLELVDVVRDEGVSAKDLDRPGLRRVLDAIERGEADAVLVTKLDRLVRSVRYLDELVSTYFGEGAAALLSISENFDTSSAVGRLLVNILGSVGQWEREAIAERTREALAEKRRSGKRAGSVPYGFDLAADGSTLIERDDEQRAIALAFDLRAQGSTFREIADALDAAAMVPRGGRRWHPQTVANIVRQEQRRRDEAPEAAA